MPDLTLSETDKELLATFIRRRVSIPKLGIMYCCTTADLITYVRTNLPQLSNVLALCPREVPHSNVGEEYPPFLFKRRRLK